MADNNWLQGDWKEKWQISLAVYQQPGDLEYRIVDDPAIADREAVQFYVSFKGIAVLRSLLDAVEASLIKARDERADDKQAVHA